MARLKEEPRDYEYEIKDELSDTDEVTNTLQDTNVFYY